MMGTYALSIVADSRKQVCDVTNVSESFEAFDKFELFYSVLGNHQVVSLYIQSVAAQITINRRL